MGTKRLAPGLQRDDEGAVRCKWPAQHEDYALIQAMGMVNDHIEGCESRALVDVARASFKRPS